MDTKQPTYIILQSYGHESILQECIFALLTLCYWYPNGLPDNIQVWIYTDNPDYFRQFNCSIPLHFGKMDVTLIKQWRGSIDFVHRVKIELLRDFIKDHSGNVLYLDTDICFLRPVDALLQAIDDGHFYMHVMEGIIAQEANPIFRKLNAFLKNNRSFTITNKPIIIPADIAMWNAGVLGFKTNDSKLEQVLEFTDTLYTSFPKHVVEQFTFSLFFQMKGNVHAAAPYILHYWNLKELRIVLSSFFQYFRNVSWSELVRYSCCIQVPVFMQEKISFLENRSILQKLQKVKWEPTIPDWSSAVQQLN